MKIYFFIELIVVKQQVYALNILQNQERDNLYSLKQRAFSIRLIFLSFEKIGQIYQDHDSMQDIAISHEVSFFKRFMITTEE